jgi:hypothetical protein
MKSQTNTHMTPETSVQLDYNSESALKNTSANRFKIIRHIDYCLTPCDQCTGLYIDSIKGDILRIICDHQCHSRMTKPISNITPMSKSLECNGSKTGMRAS